MTQVNRTEGLVGNTAFKAPCRVATTASLGANMAGLAVIDGIQTVSGDRVLRKNETTGSLNGIWTADTGTWIRTDDFDGVYDVSRGTLVYITEGTLAGGTCWQVTTPDPIAIGTTSLAFAQGLFSSIAGVSFIDSGTGAVATTVQDDMRAGWVKATRYGVAVASTAAANSTGLQNALNTGKSVLIDAAGIINYDTGLKMKASGQILAGMGMGDNSVSGMTVLKYTGGAAGKMISFYDGTAHQQNGGVRDLLLNGNALANRGIELYNDVLAGGAWRQQIQRVAIYGVTNGAAATGVYGGAGTGNDNANDFLLDSVHVFGSAYGLQTGGAHGCMTGHCTIQGSTTAGVKLTAGAAVSLGDTTFSANVWDIIETSAQTISAAGAWFENSTQGIFQATTAISALSMVGCLLHTSNATRLMDMQNAAGNFSLKGCFVPVSSASTLLKNINGSYEYDVSTSNVTIDPGYKQWVQGSIRSDNCAFMVGQTNDAANATGDGTVFSMNGAAVTKLYDLATAVAAGTGIFTAPLNGYYEFDVQVAIGLLGAAHTDLQLTLVTTGQTYAMFRCSPGPVRSSGNELFVDGRVRCLLAAGNTAYPAVTISGSTKTVTVESGGAATNWRTRFSGRMV